MNHTYKNLLKRLHEKYPEKHIDISPSYNYYEHDNTYKTVYLVYIAGVYCKHIPTLKEVRLCVSYLCKKEV